MAMRKESGEGRGTGDEESVTLDPAGVADADLLLALMEEYDRYDRLDFDRYLLTKRLA